MQAHRANDRVTLRRMLAAAPTTVEVDVGLREGELVVAHDYDLNDDSGLKLEWALAAAGNARLNVEAKCRPPETPSPREFVRALKPFLPHVALCSFDERVLIEAHRVRPGVETTFLFDRPLRVATAATTLGPSYELVTRELVECAHLVGLRVVPFTVNDVRAMAALIDLGVDGLVTDEPALAREVAGSRLQLAA